MSIDINKFDKDFRKHQNFRQFSEEINRSPLLIDLINRFAGEIKLGDSGSGGFYSPDEKKINIDVNWVNKIFTLSGPNYAGRLATMLAHELGHAVVPGGLAYTNNQMRLPEYIDAHMESEGVAIWTEYLVARELNVLMWSSEYGKNSIHVRLDNALVNYGGNTNNPQFASDAVMIGAQEYVTKNPSNASHLNYVQYYAAWHVLQYGQHSYSREQIKRIDWENIRPEDAALKPEIAGQKREFANSLPLQPSSVAYVTSSQFPAQKFPLASAASYRQDKIKRARQSYEHAQNAFWTSGSVLIGLRAEIEQHARANRADPGEMLASVFSSTPPPGFSRRVKEAIAASPEAQTLEKDVRQAQRHLELQICRSAATPSPEAEASRGGRSLGL